jgi:hypothetical protein
MLTSYLHLSVLTSTHKLHPQVLSAILPVRDDAVTLPVVRDTDSAEVASRASVSSLLPSNVTFACIVADFDTGWCL